MTSPTPDQSLIYPPRQEKLQDLDIEGDISGNDRRSLFTSFRLPPCVWFLLGALVSCLIISLSAIPDNVSWLENLSNGRPVAGEMGLGRFSIVGYNKTFVYPWRLKLSENPEKSAAARATAWTCYFLHQFGQYLIIYLAQRAKSNDEIKWSNNYNKYNLWMMKLNGVFIALHFLQTHLFYDGLAGDVPEVTALGSVALFLVVVLILEMPRRGIFFSKAKGFPYLDEFFIPFVRKYHPYFISFGLVYNFWYHPMEGTFAHLCGFFYQFIIFWQSCIFFNTEHKNRNWTLLVEITVWFHGALTAVFQKTPNGWLSFTYGFFFLFVVTQFWGIPVVHSFIHKSTKHYLATLVGILLVFIILAVVGYHLSGNLKGIYTTLSITATDYIVIGVFYAWFIISYWLVWLVGKIVRCGESSSYTVLECVVMAIMAFLINVIILATLPIFVG